jgi:hypothetical protein
MIGGGQNHYRDARSSIAAKSKFLYFIPAWANLDAEVIARALVRRKKGMLYLLSENRSF